MTGIANFLLQIPITHDDRIDTTRHRIIKPKILEYADVTKTSVPNSVYVYAKSDANTIYGLIITDSTSICPNVNIATV